LSRCSAGSGAGNAGILLSWKAARYKAYAGAIEALEVGAEVGNVNNNRPELMDRVGLL
jgi:hypothetical protein